MLTNLHLLWKVNQQSSFAGIDNSAMLNREISSTILNGQINTKPGMLSLFKIHSSVTAFGFFLSVFQ